MSQILRECRTKFPDEVIRSSDIFNVVFRQRGDDLEVVRNMIEEQVSATAVGGLWERTFTFRASRASPSSSQPRSWPQGTTRCLACRRPTSDASGRSWLRRSSSSIRRPASLATLTFFMASSPSTAAIEDTSSPGSWWRRRRRTHSSLSFASCTRNAATLALDCSSVTMRPPCITAGG